MYLDVIMRLSFFPYVPGHTQGFFLLQMRF